MTVIFLVLTTIIYSPQGRMIKVQKSLFKGTEELMVVAADE